MPDFVHGIRFRLLMAALVLLVIPVLAAQFIARMESFLRDAQEANGRNDLRRKDGLRRAGLKMLSICLKRAL